LIILLGEAYLDLRQQKVVSSLIKWGLRGEVGTRRLALNGFN
jgi:hypothetical protein